MGGASPWWDPKSPCVSVLTPCCRSPAGPVGRAWGSPSGQPVTRAMGGGGSRGGVRKVVCDPGAVPVLGVAVGVEAEAEPCKWYGCGQDEGSCGTGRSWGAEWGTRAWLRGSGQGAVMVLQLPSAPTVPACPLALLSCALSPSLAPLSATFAFMLFSKPPFFQMQTLQGPDSTPGFQGLFGSRPEPPSTPTVRLGPWLRPQSLTGPGAASGPTWWGEGRGSLQKTD